MSMNKLSRQGGMFRLVASITSSAPTQLTLGLKRVERRPEDGARPPGSSFAFFNLRNPTTRLFWLIETASMIQFVLWLPIVTSLTDLKMSPRSWQHAYTRETPERRSNSTYFEPQRQPAEFATSMSSKLCVDIWFTLSVLVGIDAIAIVFTFNRQLIRRFHYAVSQRMMLLSCLFSCIPFLSEYSFAAKQCVAIVAVATILYLLFGLVLDAFEEKLYKEGVSHQKKSLNEYSKVVGCVETSWARALLHASAITSFGLALTKVLRPPWSPLVPIGHILFEVRERKLANNARTCDSTFIWPCSLHSSLW